MDGEGVTAAMNQISNILDSFIAKPKTIDGGSTRNEIGASLKASPQRTQPLSRTAYIERLKTYGPGRWSVCGDPSPLECARWGWMVVEEDVLQCVTCKRVVYAALPSIRDRDAYKKFLNVLKSRIHEAHSDCCGWRKHPSPYAFTLPAVLDTKEDLHNLRNTVHSIAALNSALPYINNAELMLKLGIGSEIILEFLDSSQVLDETKLTAALLALCGWTKGHGSTLRCNVCQRSLGLWAFVTRAGHAKNLQQQEKHHISSCFGKRKLQEDHVSSQEAEKTDVPGVENQVSKRLCRSSTEDKVSKSYSYRSESVGKDSSDEMDIDRVEECENRIEEDRDAALNAKLGIVEGSPMALLGEQENSNREAEKNEKSGDTGTNKLNRNGGHSAELGKNESKTSSETKSLNNQQNVTTTTSGMSSGIETDMDKTVFELDETKSHKIQINADVTETEERRDPEETDKTKCHFPTLKSGEEMGDKVEKSQEMDKNTSVEKRSQWERAETKTEGKPYNSDRPVSDICEEKICKPKVDQSEDRTNKNISEDKGCKEEINKSSMNEGNEIKQDSDLVKGSEANYKKEGTEAKAELESGKNVSKSMLGKDERRETKTEWKKSNEGQVKTVSDKSSGRKIGTESEVTEGNKAVMKFVKNKLDVHQPGMDIGESTATRTELERISDSNTKVEADKSVNSGEEAKLDSSRCSKGIAVFDGSQNRVGFSGDNTDDDSVMVEVEEDDPGTAGSVINTRSKGLPDEKGAVRLSSTIKKKGMDSSRTMLVIRKPKTLGNESDKSGGNTPCLRSDNKRCRAGNSSPVLLIGSSPSTQLKQIEKHVYLQPLNEHRYWCAWVTVRPFKDLQDVMEQDEASKQKCKEGLVGYNFVCQQLKQVMLTKDMQWGSSVKYAGNVQGLRSIRALLYDWGSTIYNENDL